MLTQTGVEERRVRLWERIPERISWVLIGDPRHVQYFSGFRVNPISFSADQRCLLLLQREGTAVLMADNFTRRSASATPVITEEVIVPWYDHKHSVKNRDHALLTALEECRERWCVGQGWVEAEAVAHLPAQLVGDFSESQPVPTETDRDTSLNTIDSSMTLGSLIRRLRRRKHADEIALLRCCMAACDAGHAAAFDAVRPGVSELEVYLAIQQAAQSAAGCPCVVYGDFRATNAVTHKAGGLPTSYVLQEGDLFIVDYSVVIAGYRSDFTNTIAVGSPSVRQQAMADACCRALLHAELILKPGVRAAEAYETASASLREAGFPSLGHHAGHGLGLEHPEPPILVPDSEDILEPGDVITLEPGLYVEGVGGMRFEHNYLITETGAERLSGHHAGLSRHHAGKM
ncbi:MAG: aminopeptidase P family protein [Planctomycetaceae bacterium]|nr:aminopeptidase P family protein [Planctomycetaceae bacterium]